MPPANQKEPDSIAGNDRSGSKLLRLTDVAVKRATVEDAEPFAELFMNARREMAYLPRDLHTDEETRGWMRSLLEDDQNTALKAITSDGTVAGFCIFNDRMLEHLYIDPTLQRRSIGGKLLQAAQRDRNYVELWVFQKNKGAIQFYKSYGFTLAEETDGVRNEEHEPDAHYVWSNLPTDGADSEDRR